MTILIKLIVWVAIVMILEVTVVFAFKLGDKVNRKRMKKLENTIAFLKDCRKADGKDYRAMYQRALEANMKLEELKKENEELKKQLDKQGRVTYNYYVNK